jgi:hypothetical protein
MAEGCSNNGVRQVEKILDSLTTRSSSAMQERVQLLEGVVFHRTVRSTYAVVLLAVNDTDKVVVRIQMKEPTLSALLRSWCRRTCKIGDLLVLTGNWMEIKQSTTEWIEKRFVVDIANEADAATRIVMKDAKHWEMRRCQDWQKRYMAPKKDNQEIKKIQRQEKRTNSSAAEQSTSSRHGGGIGKRKQGEQLANFLIHVMLQAMGAPGVPESSSEWGTTKPKDSLKAIQQLNSGSGVVDAAGGSGHVSMALGLSGVKSTVVDPRENVGKLPGKDRKVWNKAKRNLVTVSSDGIPLCQPIVPYDALRAWFSSKPDGVDTSHRHPDEDEVAVCAENHALLEDCSAIVALHPDEATDAIVDMAVRKRVPFVIMPCCVFSRLFPGRRLANSIDPVCTYADLIDYLMAKDPAIQKTVLPFEGANIALWATFT